MIRSIALIFFLAAGAAQANTIDCGGNSYSYAEVVSAPRQKAAKGRPAPAMRRQGPVEVMPDSLCADLIERRRNQIDTLDVLFQGGVDAPPAGDRRPARRR